MWFDIDNVEVDCDNVEVNLSSEFPKIATPGVDCGISAVDLRNSQVSPSATLPGLTAIISQSTAAEPQSGYHRQCRR